MSESPEEQEQRVADDVAQLTIWGLIDEYDDFDAVIKEMQPAAVAELYRAFRKIVTQRKIKSENEQ